MEWISVKDRLPYLYKTIIFLDDISEIYIGYRDKNNFFTDSHYIISGITHWMPLPELPKE